MSKRIELSDREIRQIQRQVIEISQPFVRMKVDVVNRALPKMIVSPTGMVAEYDKATQALLDEIEARRQEAIRPLMNKLGEV